jgi:hypothetical protein
MYAMNEGYNVNSKSGVSKGESSYWDKGYVVLTLAGELNGKGV